MRNILPLNRLAFLFAALTLSSAGCASHQSTDSESAALQVQPPVDHYQVARTAFGDGNMEEAGTEVKLALQDNPYDAKSHFLFGSLLEMSGDHDQAVVAYKRALELDGTDPAGLYSLGTLLLRRGEVVPATRLLENATMIRPDHTASWNNLAKAYYEVGLPELTIAAYEEALRQDPWNAIALANLLLLAEAAGHEDAATSYQQRLEKVESGYDTKLAAAPDDGFTPAPAWPIASLAATFPASGDSPAIAAPQEGAPDDTALSDLREFVRDLPNVKVERRGGRLTLTGWTSSSKEKTMLGQIMARSPDILDLTGDDTGDADRMIEIDAVILLMTNVRNESIGFNFLDAVNVNFNYFASNHRRDGTGYSAPPNVTGPVLAAGQSGWIFGASVDYLVNIANVSADRVTVLSRPHLTTLSGTPARFLAGGELVYSVSGLNSGDIKPYPFGTTLTVTPTLMRSAAPDGTPRVHIVVEAGRKSVLSILSGSEDPSSFTSVEATSEAILSLGQTLIMSGFSQRERQEGHEGVPILMHLPFLKYFFSTKTTVESNSAVIILLTPREPRFWDEQNREETASFLEMRRAFLKASQGTPEDMRRYREQYPEWGQMMPNRWATHFFMLENSALYQAVSGQELKSEDLEFDALTFGRKQK